MRVRRYIGVPATVSEHPQAQTHKSAPAGALTPDAGLTSWNHFNRMSHVTYD